MLTDDDIEAIRQMMAILLEEHGLAKQPSKGALRTRRYRMKQLGASQNVTAASRSVTGQGQKRHKTSQAVTKRHTNGNGEEAPTHATWNAYSDAYCTRYGVEPTRNRMVNGQLAQFVARVPAAEAPEIAAFYVGHNRAFYVSSRHAVGGLLRDAESLRTQWLSGRTVTDTEARQVDRTQATGNAFAPLIEEARERAKRETH